jgi:hypothetical protein
MILQGSRISQIPGILWQTALNQHLVRPAGIYHMDGRSIYHFRRGRKRALVAGLIEAGTEARTIAPTSRKTEGATSRTLMVDCGCFRPIMMRQRSSRNEPTLAGPDIRPQLAVTACRVHSAGR